MNVFANKYAETWKTVSTTVEKIAEFIGKTCVQASDKDRVKLINFNQYREDAENRKTVNIEWAYAVAGDWDKNFDQTLFEQGMAELANTGAQVIAYQTYSHTTEAPRWRIFVFLGEPISPADYRTCWDGLNDLFGGNLDPNAKDCARINYMRSCPPGEIRDFRTLNIEVA
jgi:hypothetical protein